VSKGEFLTFKFLNRENMHTWVFASKVDVLSMRISFGARIEFSEVKNRLI